MKGHMRINKLSCRLSQAGFTLVEIMIVVAIIGLLAAVAIPNFVRARSETQRTICISNLRSLEGAKMNWALEQKRSGSDVPTDGDLFGSTLYIKEKPACPGNGTYSLNAVDSKPVCSISTHTL